MVTKIADLTEVTKVTNIAIFAMLPGFKFAHLNFVVDFGNFSSFC